MGGAGLALPVDVAENIRLNPALRSFNRGFKFDFPSLGYELDGVSISDLRDYAGNVNGGGLNDNNLVRYARQLGGRDTRYGFDAGIGFLVDGFSLMTYGQATVLGKPNQDLRNWSNAGSLNNPPVGSQLDAYGLGYHTVDLGYGKPTSMKNGSLALGGTLRIINAYYGHKIVRFDGAGVNVANGAEVQGADTNSKSGVGVDVGAIYTVKSTPRTHYGLVVQNLVEPSVRFDRQVADSAAVLGDNITPFKRAINVGVGHITENGKWLLAADLIDLGNNAGRGSLALGAMYNVSRSFGVGAGYNSLTGLTLGFSLFGINVAFENQRPRLEYEFKF
ncbi:hypothetical protein BH11ARM2_BH11ARM2_36320 [soil metagenome]